MPFWIWWKLSFALCFFQKNGWNQRIPTNWIKLGKIGWHQRVLGKDVKHCLRWFLSFGVWNPCLYFADFFCWVKKPCGFTTFFWWRQDWNLLSHRCKSSCWKRPLGVLFPYSMSCRHALKQQKRCWWFVCVCLFPAKCLVVYVSPPPRCILTLWRL